MAKAIFKTVLGAFFASTAVVTATAQMAIAQGFTGDFAPGEWELFNSSPIFSPNVDEDAVREFQEQLAPFNGSVEFSDPDALTLLGSNQSEYLEQFGLTCGTAPSNFVSLLCRDSFTALYVTVPDTGELFFDWEYATEDSLGPAFDLFGYFVSDLPPEVLPDSPFNQLSDSAGEVRQRGSTTVSVNADEIFGFNIGTGDNEGGRALVTITNFGIRISEPDEDTPTSVPEPTSGIAIAALAGLALRWNKK
ncbi:hypothetical protein [Leptothoe kymatousa]|uniref:PEP-CTERM protein-sorting domain-containing protein n=1 Tax=Leptothoe kymatousa TAU-MAC 1615 TaxID=2364775 RepID=A0ABS5Y299_9CYAN|nr:hypothetical protein [Leptothoe kymatousa]MBT9311963.1 hypothetical protein [Leptothoe kymatousa TAU-MAC 1615]